jgi:4'-phosphopantetheinyl transferase
MLATATGPAPPRAPDLRFSLSHSGDLALVAIALGSPVGIDVEHMRRDVSVDTVASPFSEREQERIRALPPDLRPLGFYNCWTRKEAYLNAREAGLSISLTSFQVSLSPGAPAKLLRVDGHPEEPSRWTLKGLFLLPEYVAALAVEGHVREAAIRYHAWPESYVPDPHAATS